MRIVKKENGEEMISTNDGPGPKPERPASDEVITTGNIDSIRAKRAAEKTAAEAEVAKIEAGKKEVQKNAKT